jgi:hypothetical protein
MFCSLEAHRALWYNRCLYGPLEIATWSRGCPPAYVVAICIPSLESSVPTTIPHQIYGKLQGFLQSGGLNFELGLHARPEAGPAALTQGVTPASAAMDARELALESISMLLR